MQDTYHDVNVLAFQDLPDDSSLWPYREKQEELDLQRNFITLGGPEFYIPPGLDEGDERHPEQARAVRHKRRTCLLRSQRFLVQVLEAENASFWEAQRITGAAAAASASASDD